MNPAGWLAASPFTEQAQVTNWPARVGWVLVCVLLVGLAMRGMRGGWRRRALRQAHLPAPAAVPEGFVADAVADVAAVYLATTDAADWLDRIVVHDLGQRARVSVAVGAEGVAVVGSTRAWFIPAHDVVAVRLDRGIAGAVYEEGGVLTLTWRLGEALVDSGFRAQDAESQVSLHAAVAHLVAMRSGS